MFMHNGQPYIWLLPDCLNETQARRKASAKLGGRNFQILCRPYKDTARLTAEMKAETLDNTADPDIALRRMKHTDIKDDDDDGQAGVPAEI